MGFFGTVGANVSLVRSADLINFVVVIIYEIKNEGKEFACCTMARLLRLLPLLFFYVAQPANCLQNVIPRLTFPSPMFSINKGKARELEDELLKAIQDEGNRLANSERINSLVKQLENNSQSITEPAIAAEVYGRWRLMHTTNAATSSPIQRKAVDTAKFPIYQDIIVNEKGQLQVNQIVQFSEKAILSVDALASTAAYPLPEFTDRQSTGEVLGINILGVSLVGEVAQPNPDRPNSRIDFVFEEGNFDFDGLKIPYPVPFRLPLLRDWVKGWIDITWLSDRVRIARGNKGTTFVLIKESGQSI